MKLLSKTQVKKLPIIRHFRKAIARTIKTQRKDYQSISSIITPEIVQNYITIGRPTLKNKRAKKQIEVELTLKSLNYIGPKDWAKNISNLLVDIEERKQQLIQFKKDAFFDAHLQELYKALEFEMMDIKETTFENRLSLIRHILAKKITNTRKVKYIWN